MKRIHPFLMFVAVVGLVFAARTAAAQSWDTHGWVKLGEREVNGKFDHDTIEVGTQGRYSKLTLAVEKSDIELIDFEVTFLNGEKFHPESHHYFEEGQRTRVIDLPGDDRIIKQINLRYKNLPGGGHARVEVWGLERVTATRAPVRKPFSWDNNGWVMLGERDVNGHGREDHDRIEVGRHEGRFAKLMLVVLDGELEMDDFEIKFERGPAFHPAIKQIFNEGSRTRPIDFPGDERAIKFVDFHYRNLTQGGHAKVQVWAK